MAKDPRTQLQQVIDGRNQKSASAAAAAGGIVNFQDWLFFGNGADIFVNVGITPTQPSPVTYAVVVFQTPSGFMLGNASVGTDNAGPNWALNLALSIDNYSIQQYGNQVQAWAFAQIQDGTSQYSQVQNYTVNP